MGSSDPYFRERIEAIGVEMGELVARKNAAYGNSFLDSAKFMELLFPDGVRPDQYTDLLLVTRIFDKLKRIATRKKAFDESPYRDIVGYGILGIVNDEVQED